MMFAAVLSAIAFFLEIMSLSGIHILERCSGAVQRIRLETPLINIRLDFTIALISFIQCCTTYAEAVQKHQQWRESKDSQLLTEGLSKSKAWRSDRNVMIWSLNVYLWLTLAFTEIRVRKLRAQIQQKREEVNNTTTDNNKLVK